MRALWWYAIAGGVVLVALVVVGFVVLEGGGGTAAGQPPPPPAGFQSYGNTKISVQAIPNGTYRRTFVLRAKDRKTGSLICGAKLTVYGQMIRPHLMTLLERGLRQERCGMYKGRYTFIMPGDWRANFVLRTKKGDSSTASLPLKIGP